LKINLLAATIAVTFLTGCSQTVAFVHGDWIDDETARTAVPVAESRSQPPQMITTGSTAPAAAPTISNSSFCRSVATSDVSIGNFDAKTQQRMIAQTYQQCVAIFGGVN
jgi:hypothetical protein